MIYVFVECGLARPVQYCSAGSVLLIALFPWNVFHYGHSKGEEDGVFTISSRDDVSKNHAAGSGSWQCGCQRQDGGD